MVERFTWHTFWLCRLHHIHVLLCVTAPRKFAKGGAKCEMKIFVVAGIIAVMLLDAFLCWCLLRASSIESRKEEIEDAARNRRET